MEVASLVVALHSSCRREEKTLGEGESKPLASFAPCARSISSVARWLAHFRTLPWASRPLSFVWAWETGGDGAAGAAMGQPRIRLFRVVETHTFWDHHGGTTAPALRDPRHKYARCTTRRGIKSFRPPSISACRRAILHSCPAVSTCAWTLACWCLAASVAPARLQAVCGSRLDPWRQPGRQSALPPVAAWALKFDILGSLTPPLHSHAKQTTLTFLVRWGKVQSGA